MKVLSEFRPLGLFDAQSSFQSISTYIRSVRLLRLGKEKYQRISGLSAEF